MANKLSPEQERLLNYLGDKGPTRLISLEGIFSKSTIMSMIRRELVQMVTDWNYVELSRKGHRLFRENKEQEAHDE